MYDGGRVLHAGSLFAILGAGLGGWSVAGTVSAGTGRVFTEFSVSSCGRPVLSARKVVVVIRASSDKCDSAEGQRRRRKQMNETLHNSPPDKNLRRAPPSTEQGPGHCY